MLLSIMKDNANASVVAVDTLERLKALILESDWSPAIFKNNYRNNANFESTSLMVLDIDEGIDIKKALELFAPYRFILATTRSHQKDKHGVVCDRFRVILFLSKEVKDRDTFTATWFALQKEFPFIDEKCKDPARFFYKCTDAFIHLNPNGKTIDPVAALPKEEPKPRKRSANPGAELKGKLSSATQRFLSFGADPGKWNDALFKAAKDCYEQGYDMEWFQSRAWLVMEEHRDDFASKEEESLKTIESAFSKDPKYPQRGLEMPDIRDKVMASHLFVANHDHNLTKLIDLESGKIHDIAHENIKNRLGLGKHGEYAPWASTNLRYANFIYEPHLNKVISTDDDGMACFNTYEPPAWRREEFYFGKEILPEPEMPERYKKFLTHLVGGDQASYDYLVDWLANSLQSRNFTILCAIGEQGIGKGRLGEIMKHVHGNGNFVKVRDQVFKSQFNGQLANRTFVQVDEAILDSKEAIDRVKDVVNGDVEIEKKGEDARSMRNHASFYLSSNSFDAVKLEPGDRRFSIIELTDTKIDYSPEIKALMADSYLFDPIEIDKLARYLRFKPIESNLMRPFTSARWERVREASLSEWEQWVVFDWAPEEAGTQMDLDKFQEKVQTKMNVKPPGRSKIEALCRKYPEVLTVARVDGKRKIIVKGEPDAKKKTTFPSKR